MSRLYAFCAIAEGMGATIVNALPSTVYRHGGPEDSEPGRGRRLVYSCSGEEYHILLFSIARGVDFGPVSAAPTGHWDLWMLVADSRDASEGHYRWLARVWRYLLRESVSHPGWFRGPYSAAYVDEQWSALAAAWLRNEVGDWSFPSLAGDSHEVMVAWDYRPTQSEVDNDTDWEPPVQGG